MKRSMSTQERNIDTVCRIYIDPAREKLPTVEKASGFYTARRARPVTAPLKPDVEHMSEQIHQLKVANSQLRDEKTKLQTRVYRLENEIKKFQKAHSHDGRPLSASSSVAPTELNVPMDTARSRSRTPRKDTPENDGSITQRQEEKDDAVPDLGSIYQKFKDLVRILESRFQPTKELLQQTLESIEKKLQDLLVDRKEISKATEKPRSAMPHPTIELHPPTSPTPFLEPKPAPVLSPHPPSFAQRKPSFVQRKNSFLMKPRNSISMIFTSSSSIQLPQSRRNVTKQDTQIESYSKLVAFLVDSKSRLNGIQFDVISWDEFWAWISEQPEDDHESIIREMFYISKSYRKVLNITTQISFCQKVEEVVIQVKKGIKDILLAERVDLYTIISPGELCLFQNDPDAKPKTMPTSRGIIGHVAEAGEMINLNDPYANPSYEEEIDSPDGLVVSCMLLAPLIDRFNQVFAVAVAYNKATGPFLKEDEFMMQSLVDQASNSIQHFKLLFKTMRAQQKNQCLLEVLKVVNNDSATLDEIIDKIIKVTYEVLNADRVSLFLVDNIAHQLLLKVSKDNITIRIPIGVGIAGTVAATGMVINIMDAYKDPRFDPTMDKKTGYRTRTILCMPIKDSNNRPVAVIQVLNKSHGSFTKDDEEILAAFSAEAASVLQRKSLETAYMNLMGGTSETDASSSFKDMIEEYTMHKRTAKSASQSDEVRIKIGSSSSNIHVQGIKDWDFDHFAYSDEELMNYVISGFDSLGLLHQFKIESETLRNFLELVRSKYRENPYHNFVHAFSVFHSVYMMLTTTELSQILTPIDILALFVAALCHDLDHPGTNNTYQINSKSLLALRYNDISVLENHHASLTFQLLQDKTANILAGVDPEDRTEFRRIVISAILSTDMTQHAKLTTDLSVHSGKFSRDKKEDRLFLCQIMLHSADLCNPVLPEATAYKWASLVLSEFNSQVSLEKEKGLPFANFMEKSDEVSKANLNINFIKYVVSPLWTRFAEIFPGLKICIDRMDQNLLKWTRIVQENSPSSP